MVVLYSKIKCDCTVLAAILFFRYACGNGSVGSCFGEPIPSLLCGNLVEWSLVMTSCVVRALTPKDSFLFCDVANIVGKV